MKKLTALFITSILILSACGSSKFDPFIEQKELVDLQQLGELGTYQSEEFGFALAYPNTFTPSELVGRDSLNQKLLLQFDDRSTDELETATSIYAPIEFSVYTDTNLEELKKDFTAMPMLGKLFTSHKEMDKLKGINTVTGNVVTRFYYLDKKGKAFVADLNVEDSDYETTFFLILESLNFKQ